MMKNLLLILFLFAVGISFGQVTYPTQASTQINSLDPEPVDGHHPQPLQQRVLPVDIVEIGSASNMWTVINANQSQVDYDPELGLLTFVHRQNVSLHPIGGSGTIRYDMSTDQGATWTVDNGPLTPQMVSGNGSVPVETSAGEAVVTGPRYPNGIIYNPPGNQDIANAYYVAVGPCQMSLNGGLGAWGLTFQSSQKLDGSAAVDNYPVHFDDDVLGPGDGTPTSLCQAGEAVHALGADAATVGDITVPWKGVLNGDGSAFDWTQTDIESGLLRSGSTNMAFSPDGTMGYFVIGGADQDQLEPWRIPNVYSTSDNGDSWTLTSADLDIANTEVGGLLSGWAYTRNFDCVVDAADNLHVFCEIMQAEETDPATWEYAGYMVDFVWDGTDWTEHIIGQIDDAVSSGFADGTFQDQFTHPQASISADGTVASFIWTSSLDSDVNDQPDIFGRAMNTVNGEMTPIKNLTEDSEAEAVCYYPTAASTLITDGDDMDYEIPIVAFIDWTGSNLDAVQFYYLKGLGFDNSDFVVGIEEESPFSGLMLYPNPANNTARLTFNVEDIVDATIRVSDVLGKVHSVIANPTVLSGQNNFDLDVSDLSNGIYTVEIISLSGRRALSLSVQH